MQTPLKQRGSDEKRERERERGWVGGWRVGLVWMVWFMGVMSLRGEGVGGVERRMALVIGCSYPESELTLPSPVKDARAMKSKLGEVGFAGKDVRLLENPTRKEMMEAIDAFGEELGRQGGVGVFYFSGHGAQHEGENYMFPAKAAIGFREDLPGEGIAASRMITRMESAKNRVNLVFLDACRNNPLASSKKKTGLGKGPATENPSRTARNRADHGRRQKTPRDILNPILPRTPTGC